MRAKDIPYGYCQCGCGDRTSVVKVTDRAKSYVKGDPRRFIMGHHRRGVPPSNMTTTIARPGVPLTEEHRRKIAVSRMGERHPLWQGDEADYNAVHKWLRRNYPKTGRCDNCGAERDRTEYAYLKRGRECTRNRDDYVELCVPCHRAYDAPSVRASEDRRLRDDLARRDSEDSLRGLLASRGRGLPIEEEEKWS